MIFTMHELGAAQSILDVVLETASKNNAKVVLKINLVVGQLTGYVDDSLQFLFEHLSRGTAAEKAELCITRVMARSECAECGNNFEQTLPLTHLCPACGHSSLVMSGGDQFFIKNIEVDDENTSD